MPKIFESRYDSCGDFFYVEKTNDGSVHLGIRREDDKTGEDRANVLYISPEELRALRDALLTLHPLQPQTTVEKLGELASLTSTAPSVTIHLTGDNLTINLGK